MHLMLVMDVMVEVLMMQLISLIEMVVYLSLNIHTRQFRVHVNIQEERSLVTKERTLTWMKMLWNKPYQNILSVFQLTLVIGNFMLVVFSQELAEMISIIMQLLLLVMMQLEIGRSEIHGVQDTERTVIFG